MKGKRKFKISIILFLISLVLPFAAYNIKPPKFIGTTETQIASFQLPEIHHFEIKEKASMKVSDPFKLAERTLPKEKLSLPVLSMIYTGKNRYVILGDSIIKEGEKWGEFRVKKINLDKILLVDKKGEKIWLKMESY
ncbi:MAG: hypothetical protein NZ809_03120 [Thermodesulfovibrio sp.]|nr:hypothetical protein [Thermodesulfovibrio sp.]